ncbi:MAG: DNA gyrase inhibitor YacG [Rhodoferax sp.]
MQTHGIDTSAVPRAVRCPTCGQSALFSPQNPYRPFCCARCKGIDFGDWASESFRVEDRATDDAGLISTPTD